MTDTLGYITNCISRTLFQPCIPERANYRTRRIADIVSMAATGGIVAAHRVAIDLCEEAEHGAFMRVPVAIEIIVPKRTKKVVARKRKAAKR